MARIPDYSSRQVRVAPIGDAGFSMRAPDASGLVRGMAQVEDFAIRRAEEEREKADTAAVMDADRQLTDWQLDTLFNPEKGVYTKKGANALDVTNGTIGQFDETQRKIGEGLKTESQRSRFKEIVTRRRQSLGADLNRYEFGERQSYYDDVDRGQLETSMQGAALHYNDPDKIAYYQSKMAAVLQSQAQRKGLPAEMAQAQLLKANSGMSTAVISRMTSDDPYRAREYFKAAQGNMTAEDQVQMSNLIEREIKSREIEARQAQAIYRAELSSRVSDATAAYLSGFDYDSPPSQAEFVASYGAEEGQQRFQQFQKSQGLGAAIRDLATADPEQRAQLLEQFNPVAGGTASAGFQQDAKLYGVLVNAASRLGKELQGDPASYVASRSPDVQRAAQGLGSGEPAAAEAYAVATIAEQRRLGVAEPKLLTDQQAAGIAAGFARTEDGGSNAADMMQQLQAQWGKHWPSVFKQLQGKLPGAAMVIGTGVDPQTASTLARIAPLKTEELKAGLPSSDTKAAKDALGESMAEFRATLSGQVGGERTFATLYSEMERLSYAYMGQGKSASEAAEQAYKAVIDDRYTLKGTWRAPKEYDADLIEAGAERVARKIDPGELSFAVPQGVSEDFAKGRVKAAIERDGYWVTLPDESGLALYYGGEAVLSTSGGPVVRSWDDLVGESVLAPGKNSFELRRSGGN
ncbi:hypothetical protein SAMN05216229_12310 [Geopseudomonas sagittaria]|uniref:Uncharacterized protein n=1 Tax=Geopseudomonas sagittaria TaxID=1135990 RepID=A0A1I5YNN4_9GAMM|nr:hypothetical protein [Pseudomonas sagittaria]SFQ45803.1 hypothetical protein SAMN05216229_12310 [Pseudomonas sagittaria]